MSSNLLSVCLIERVLQEPVSLLLMKPITCHMDFPSEQTELIHPLVEVHLVDARAQGE